MNYAPSAVQHQSEHDLAWASSQHGPACDFAHADAYIHTNAACLYPCTLELIFTPREFATDQILFSFTNVGDSGDQPKSSIIMDKDLQEMHLTATGTNRQSINMNLLTLNQPNHVIITYIGSPATASNCKAYVNGSEDVSFKGGDYWGSSEDPTFVIGSRNDGDLPYTGLMDSIKVWDRLLDERELLLQYVDPWRDYRECMEDYLLYQGAIHSGSPSYSPFWASNNNQVL